MIDNAVDGSDRSDAIGGSDRWEATDAWDWYHDRSWLRGCNFLPSTAVNSTEVWQRGTFDPETIDLELGWAEEIGLNTIRVFCQFLVWRDDPEGFRDRVDRLLDAAAGHGIDVMLVLFDDCRFADAEPSLGSQPDPMPGVHNSRWTPSPGHEMVVDEGSWGELRAYVTDLVSTFGEDHRVLAWDVYNEPGNSGMGEDALPLLRNAFGWAREEAPDQPLTAGCWGEFETIDETCRSLSDVLTFHAYSPVEDTASLVHELQSLGRPVVCTEWMARTLDSRFETHLPYFFRANVGWYCWGLVNGKTQTHYTWETMEEPADDQPDPWFHDVFRDDGTPYDERETALVARYAECAECRNDGN